MTTLLLKEYLDHLNEQTLKDFQWHLRQIQIDRSQPFPVSRLPENSSRQTTVDKLVEVFGEDGAVERTVETLREIKHNDLASKLKQAKENQSMEQREEEPETSSAREEPREVDPTFSECRCFFFADHTGQQRGHSWSSVHNDWKRNIVGECSPSEQIIHEVDPPIRCDYLNDTEPFQIPPENIREKQEALKNAKQWCDSSIERIKTQSFNTEKEITDVFKMLHASLDEEEKTKRDALRKEARLKIRMIHLMHEKIKIKLSLSDTMAEIAKLGADKRFTETRATQKIRMRRALKKLRISSKAQINVSKHVENLQLTVLEKMWNDIKQNSVVVDPKTASSRLSVDGAEDEAEQGRAETFREEGAQS